MEAPEGPQDVVHPEVRAHINSLVSALGGFSTEEEGQYQLGDDAFEVLRDLKRWIRFYDEKTNRMDVARCLYEANLIEGDLLPILAKWRESESENKFRSRISLACFELMVPLTWPMDNDKERMTNNHYRHMPVLEQAQIAYKRAIINFDGARILHAAVRASLPSISQPIGERSTRDQGIVKLVLFFLRNMAMISPSPNTKYDGDESQISRSATVDAFSFQDIFMFLLTVASNMGEDFRTEDTAVMEIIYHLVKRVEPEMLFMDHKQRSSANAGELSALMSKEEAMLKAYNRTGPTRHNRFGTMIWVKRDGTKMSALSGQDALADPALRYEKMDKSKTWRPPRRRMKDEQLGRDLGLKPKLNSRATEQLKSFVDDFLDSGFNPLFSHIRKTIDREATHVMSYHRGQFFYLVAWFLEAERARQKANKSAGKSKAADVGTFNLVAGVLNQEMFITLNKALHEAFDMKDWHDLAAIMRCFTQILLTVQEMSTSGNEEDEEIAENILSRLFYEESTHDYVAKIILSYKAQSFDYLDAATELVHHFLRILEFYSKQNVDMQVRSRKRARRKKKAAEQNPDGQDRVEDLDNDEGSGEDEVDAQKVTKERKFEFHRFASKFSPQSAVDTFVTFTKFYQDLSDAQLKRAHRFFYRIAFKQEMSVMLFRVDIIHLFYNMIKGPQPLDKAKPSYKDWEELVKQILRKCTKKIDERPELIVEMLFSKQGSTAFFLEHGHQKMKPAKAQPKPGAELDFRYTHELDRQIAIVVGVLLDRNQNDHIAWLKRVLTEAETERRAWAAAEDSRAAGEDPFTEEIAGGSEKGEASLFTIKPDDGDRATAIFKNSHLRLLMTLCSCTRVGPVFEETPESLWVVPSSVTADTLKDALHFINQAEFSPPTFENGQSAEQQLKRKTLPRRKVAFDDDEEEGDVDEDFLFPVGGPTARSFIDDSERPKTGKKHRRSKVTSEEPDDEELALRARKRRDRELEKARRVKSALYVQDGDSDFGSDEDEEFFAREKETAAKARRIAQTAMIERLAGPNKAEKKKKAVWSDSSDEDEDVMDSDASLADGATAKRKAGSQNAMESGTDDTPLSEGDESEGSARKKRKTLGVPELAALLDDEDQDMPDDGDNDALIAEKLMPSVGIATAALGGEEDDDDAPVLARRPRVRGGFVIDSSDDDDDA